MENLTFLHTYPLFILERGSCKNLKKHLNCHVIFSQNPNFVVPNILFLNISIAVLEFVSAHHFGTKIFAPKMPFDLGPSLANMDLYKKNFNFLRWGTKLNLFNIIQLPSLRRLNLICWLPLYACAPLQSSKSYILVLPLATSTIATFAAT